MTALLSFLFFTGQPLFDKVTLRAFFAENQRRGTGWRGRILAIDFRNSPSEQG
jgi:hypothetical protein